MPPDQEALAVAARVASLLRAGASPDALFGTLIPVLLEMARAELGEEALIAQLEATIAEWRTPKA